MRICSLYLQPNMTVKQKMNTLTKVYQFYITGFKNMTIGKNLWLIIFIKLFIMFAILKLFFFKDFLGSKFSTDAEKSDYVIEQIINPKHK